MHAAVTGAMILGLAIASGGTKSHAAPGTYGVLSPSSVSDISAAERKAKRKKGPRRAHGPALGPIACMRGGCQHIPAGCHIEPERTMDGTPTGFDVAVCPLR